MIPAYLLVLNDKQRGGIIVECVLSESKIFGAVYYQPGPPQLCSDVLTFQVSYKFKIMFTFTSHHP